MKKCKWLGVFVCVLTVFFAMTGVANAEPVVKYNAVAAVNYAAEHWDDGKEFDGLKEDCTVFARKCVEVGGVPTDSQRVRKNKTGYTPKDYIDYLVENGYAELHPLTTVEVATTDGSGKAFHYVNARANESKVAPGDIVAYKCTNCSKGFFHLVICAPAEAEGFGSGCLRYYGHNSAVGNKLILPIKCYSCKCDESKVELYAVHITSAGNGYSAYTDKPATAYVKKNSSRKLTVSWNKVKGASSYNVFVKESSKALVYKYKTTKKTSLVFHVPKNRNAEKVSFYIRPVKKVNDKTYIGGKTKLITAKTGLMAPTISSAKLKNKKTVTIKWEKVSGATGYKVQYKAKGQKKWKLVCNTTKLSATKGKLSGGKKYTFKVTPYNGKRKVLGKKSDSVTIKTKK